MAQYFDIHVFYSRNDGYSIPVKFEDRNPDQSFDNDEIIEKAVALGEVHEDDAGQIDTVNEISEHEYNQMKGI